MNAVEAARRRMWWVGWASNGVGVLVVFATVAFLAEIYFDADIETGYYVRVGSVLAALFVVSGATITKVTEARMQRAYAWLAEEREPTEAEHRLALGHAAFQTLCSATAWAVGGLVFVAVSIDQPFAYIAAGTAAAMLGAETTLAIVYLLSERALRPLTALALAARPVERPVAPGVRTRLYFAWTLGTGVPLLGLLVVGGSALLASDLDTDKVAAAVVFLSVVALFVGWFSTSVASRAIADPLNMVRRAVERVGAGELDVQVPINDASEVGLLQAGVNRMAEGLRERERIRDLFGRQVGREVATAALRGGTRLGGEEREIGALFVDLTGSTSMALAMPPTEVVRLLNRFFRVVVDVVEAEGGIVNKFEGDAALCVFGAPVAVVDPAGDALRTARTLARRLEREVPEIGFGIGVSAGRAVAGNVGSESRFEYTVIGDPVNEAARLSDLAKERGQAVVASDAALRRTGEGEAGEWTVTERTVLRGRLEATGIAAPRS